MKNTEVRERKFAIIRNREMVLTRHIATLQLASARVSNPNANIKGACDMQFKILPMCVETIIEDSGSSVYTRGEGYVFAVKPVNYGQLRIRIKQPSDPYSAGYYWLCTVHFEKGLRPNRYFDSAEVKEFAEQYIRPYRYPSSL